MNPPAILSLNSLNLTFNTIGIFLNARPPRGPLLFALAAAYGSILEKYFWASPPLHKKIMKYFVLFQERGMATFPAQLTAVRVPIGLPNRPQMIRE